MQSWGDKSHTMTRAEWERVAVVLQAQGHDAVASQVEKQARGPHADKDQWTAWSVDWAWQQIEDARQGV